MSERRRRSCFCRCGPLVSCFCFLYGATIISFFLALYLFWLIVKPRNILFHVTNASINEFSLVTSNNYTTTTLYYNLALNLTVQNPNKNVAVYYDRHIRAHAGYGGEWFATAEITTPFRYQGKKNVTVLGLVFEGREVNATTFKERKIVERFHRETLARDYTIDLELDLRIRLWYRKIKTGHLKPPKIKCVLKVSLRSNGEFPSVDFKAVRCGHVLTSIVLSSD